MCWWRVAGEEIEDGFIRNSQGVQTWSGII